jgi:hypothetical protein
MKRGLVLVGVALAILGWYAPWVTSTRQLAALTYNALDLAEFAKFVTRAGLASVTREWFLVPIVAAALALALWANPPGQFARAWRYLITLAALLFSLVPLPPYPFLLRAYSSAEDRLSLGLSMAGVLGVILLFLFGSRITGKWRGLFFVTFAALGAVPAAWEFVHTLPSISEVYGSPAVAGWGWVATLIGFVLAAMAGWTDVKPDAI